MDANERESIRIELASDGARWRLRLDLHQHNGFTRRLCLDYPSLTHLALNDKHRPFQFSVLRLALALSAFGIPFALFGRLGNAGILLATLVGGVLALLMLLVRPRHQEQILTVLVGAAIGAFVYVVLGPAEASTRIHPYDDVWRLQQVLIAVGIGCLLGLAWNWMNRSR